MFVASVAATQSLLLLLLLLSGAAIVVQLVLILGHKLRRARRAAFAAAIREACTDAVLLLLAEEAGEQARRAFIASLPAAPAAREVVAELLLMSVAQVRGAARDGVLQLMDEAGFVAQYHRMLTSRTERKRALAAEALGEMRASDALPALLRLLRDRSMDVRVVATRALGKLADPDAVDPLLAGYAAGRLPSGIVSSSILRMGSAAGPTMQRALADPRVKVRTLAAELVGMMGWVLAADDLVPLLDEPAQPVRLNAVQSLGRLGVDEAVEALLAALADADAVVRAAAATALGQIGAPAAASALRRAMADAEHTVRLAAARALLGLGSMGIVELSSALREDAVETSRYAVEVLQRSGHADRMVQLWRAARPGEWSEAVASFLEALARAGGRATLEEAGIQLDANGRLLRPAPVPQPAPEPVPPRAPARRSTHSAGLRHLRAHGTRRAGAVCPAPSHSPARGAPRAMRRPLVLAATPSAGAPSAAWRAPP